MMENRYAAHPNEVKNYDTSRLREEFLMEQLFATDELVTVYSHVDRYIVGTAVPQSKDIALEVNLKDIGTDFFWSVVKSVSSMSEDMERSLQMDRVTRLVPKNAFISEKV